jgi:hypothetical protein
MPTAEREQRLEELREHLHELAREGIVFANELGSPDEYAAEWLAAAGLPEAPPTQSPSRRRRFAVLVAAIGVGCLLGAGLIWRLNQPAELTPEVLYARFAAIVDGQQPGHKGIPIHADARPNGEVATDGTWQSTTIRDHGSIDFTPGQYVLTVTCAGHAKLEGSIRLGSTTQQVLPISCTRWGVTRSTFITLTAPASQYVIELKPLNNKLAAFAYSVLGLADTRFSTTGGANDIDVRMGLGQWRGTGDGVIDLSVPANTKRIALRMTCDTGTFEVRNKQLGPIFGGDCSPAFGEGAEGAFTLVGTHLVIDVDRHVAWKMDVTALL